MSITQIAKIANVPYATAWRVINQQPVGSSDAIEAVQAAMKRIQYVPGKAKRGRPPKSVDGVRTHNVALLHLREGTPISSQVLASVQKRLSERNLNLIFAQVDHPDALPQAVKANNVDGILGYGEFPEQAVTANLRRIPAVWLMSRNDDLADLWGDRIRPDHVAIGRLAGNYLVGRKHQHVVYLNPCPGMAVYDERCDSFTRAVREKVRSVQVLCGGPGNVGLPEADWMDSVAESLTAQWLALTPRPTGVFCPVDRLTARVYGCLARVGIRPGYDLEIVSCDNQVDLLSLLQPRPTSIDLNRNTIARLAVDRLLWRMRNGMASPSIVTTVSPTLSVHDVALWNPSSEE